MLFQCETEGLPSRLHYSCSSPRIFVWSRFLFLFFVSTTAQVLFDDTLQELLALMDMVKFPPPTGSFWSFDGLMVMYDPFDFALQETSDCTVTSISPPFSDIY